MTAYRWTPPPQTGPPIVITPRMADVLTALCQGLTTRQIARRLVVTEDTVKTHIRRLFTAAGVHDRAHLIAVTSTRTVIVHDRSGWAA